MFKPYPIKNDMLNPMPGVGRMPHYRHVKESLKKSSEGSLGGLNFCPIQYVPLYYTLAVQISHPSFWCMPTFSINCLRY